MSRVESFRRDEMIQEAETLTMACIVGTRFEPVVVRLFLEEELSLDMVRVSADACNRSRKQSNGLR